MGSGAQENPDLKSQIKAALNDPGLAEEGFETSKETEGDKPNGSSTIPSRRKLVQMIKTCYQFVIKNKEGREVLWFVDMKKRGRVGKGKAPFKPDVMIWCSDRDLVSLATGEANPQKLYAAARIKIRGNIDRALKVEHILSHEREKILLAGQELSDSKQTQESGRSKL